MDSLVLLLLGAVVFLLWGGIAARQSIVSMVDFKAVYYSARCLIEHGDPYDRSELERVYLAEGGENPSAPPASRTTLREAATVDVNLPATLLLVAPIAVLGWGPAHVLWMILIAASFLLAAYLMWSCTEEHAPLICAALIGLFVATSALLLEIGNTAGIATGLCVIAAWCFLKERSVAAGVVCLAVSLVMKPQDAGLVWLFFLPAGGVYRKRAWQTLAVAVVLSVPAVLWVSAAAPHWIQELHANLAMTGAHGSLNDPGPAHVSPLTRGAIIINLQTLVSMWRDDPGLYNPVTYVVCGALLAVWAVATLLSRRSEKRDWLALATAAALAMLPVYHRQHDTRLLLLMFPAFAVLWAEGGVTGWLALAMTGAGVVLTANVALQLLGILAGHWHLAAGGWGARALNLLMVRPAPIVLSGVTLFYLWIYVRHVRMQRAESGAEAKSHAAL